MKIIVDAMGGDYAPQEIIEGAILAKDELNIDIVLVGKENIIKEYLNKRVNDFEIVNADEVVTMYDKPILSFRKKKNSSINISLNLLKQEKGDAFVSCGNTGAILAASYFILQKIPGINRPTQSAIIPTLKGLMVLVDSGANIDANPTNIVEWATMAKIFIKLFTKKEKIKIGLLNIGEEEEKGSELTKESYKLLKDKFKNEFKGNMEGKDFLYGDYDVCVTDGFTGNVALKTLEGEATFFLNLIKNIFKKNLLTKISYLFIKNELINNLKKFDYEEYGGSPILGVNGIVIVGHGRSKRKSVKNAIKIASKSVDIDLLNNLKFEKY